MSRKQFTIILIITFVVGMVWLISDIAFNTKASIPVSAQLEALLQPVDPSFNSRVLKIIDEEVVSTSVVKSSLRETKPAPAATQSAEPSL